MNAFEQYGSFFRVGQRGELESCPMMKDGSPDMEGGKPIFMEVTAPENQEMLDTMNGFFGTGYKMSQYAGR